MSARARGTRRFAAIILFALAIPFGIDMAVYPDGSSHQMLLSIGFSIVSLIWCGTDAGIRGLNLVWPARIGIFVFGPLGLMAYIIWSRGWRGLLTLLLGTLGWFAMQLTAYFITSSLIGDAATP